MNYQRLAIACVFSLVFMMPANLFLAYLELPFWVTFPMILVLGWMVGTEMRKWIDSEDKSGD